MDLESQIVGLLLQVPQVGLLVALVDLEVGKQHHVELLGRRVVQEPAGLPAQRAEGEVVEAERDLRARRGGLSSLRPSGQPGHQADAGESGRLQERSAIGGQSVRIHLGCRGSSLVVICKPEPRASGPSRFR